MRDCFRGYDDWYLDVTDAFAPWRAMSARIDEASADAVVIWSGDNASEATFLTMACWWLRHRPERVLRVAMPERTAATAVGLAPVWTGASGCSGLLRVTVASSAPVPTYKRSGSRPR
jgi:hypothetical protein